MVAAITLKSVCNLGIVAEIRIIRRNTKNKESTGRILKTIPQDCVASTSDHQSARDEDDNSSSDDDEQTVVSSFSNCKETRKHQRTKGDKSLEAPSKRSRNTSGQARGMSSRQNGK